MAVLPVYDTRHPRASPCDRRHVTGNTNHSSSVGRHRPPKNVYHTVVTIALNNTAKDFAMLLSVRNYQCINTAEDHRVILNIFISGMLKQIVRFTLITGFNSRPVNVAGVGVFSFSHDSL